jgi:hypothetical protein
MSLLSPFAGLRYDDHDDDLVRFRDNPIDDRLSVTGRSLFDALEERRDEVRSTLDDEEHDLLLLFARRRVVSARRSGSLRAITDALDAYALLPHENSVPWESWFKATLFIGRDAGLDLDDAHQRFVDGASEPTAQRADVAFDALARIDSLAQCHVIEVNTTYGPGLIETTVVRDQNQRSWGGLTGQPVTLGQYQVEYAPTTNLAQLTVSIADALDASGLVTCTSIRQDQLVGATFDLVTSGSYLESLGCLSFFADGVDDQPTFAVVVAEVGSEEHFDVHYDALDLAEELAVAADDIEDQSALAHGPCVIVLSALPSFDETASDDVIDLARFLEVTRTALSPN